MSKIGIMGGTFDPIHNGHLLIGKQAHEEYQLEKVWYMPSSQPPHKRDHHVTDTAMRCDMTKLAIADFPYFEYSDFEVRRGGFSYTAHTLKALREEYPMHMFYFIIGADSLYEIETWYHASEIMAFTTLLVARREYEGAKIPIVNQISDLQKRYHANILPLHCTELDISSTELRSMTVRDKSFVKYVPKAVETYIKEHKLYQA